MMKKNTAIVFPDAPYAAHLRSGFIPTRLLRTLVQTCTLIVMIACIIGAAACRKSDASASATHQKKELTQSLLFVLGKDFYQYSDLFTYLSEVYDSESVKTNLHILSYRDMTAKTKQPRLSLIADQLATQPVDALISLGIPEGGARILRTVKEKYPSLRIFSLLPVEEILPLEAYSDVVVDFELPDSFAKADRAVHIPAHDVQTLVLCAVTAVAQFDELPEQEPFPRFARAVATTTAMLNERGITAWGGTQYTLQPYKDPELNIRSYNYLILSPPPTDEHGRETDSETGAAASNAQGNTAEVKQ
jgi:uncharacterized lipoprotein TP_0938